MKKCLFFCLLICTAPVVSFAEYGQRFSVDNYSMHIAATQLSGRLVVSGDVKGGEPSKYLKLDIFLSDDKGHSASVTSVIKNYRYSGRFTVKKDYSNGGHWTITDVYVSK